MLWELTFIIKIGGDSKLASNYLTIILGVVMKFEDFVFGRPPPVIKLK